MTINKNQQILIVEDEETIAFAMKSYFAMSGFAVDWAREPEEAEALLTHFNYQVIIADLRLSGSNDEGGLKILDFVRMHCPATRTILLTAYKTPKIEIEARRLGADYILSKPQPLLTIKQIVTGLIGELSND